MYPDFTKFSDGNFSVKTLSNLTVVAPPYALTDMMCGKSRIGHFDGVATVVSKLFNIALPDYAFFGMKDIQQLFIIKKMVKDLDFPVKIIPCPLIREKNGLAISSRNKYLTGDEKTKALSLSKALFSIYEASKAGIRDTKKLFDSALTNLDKNVELEYLEFVDYDTFEPVTTVHRPTVCAIAAKLGSVRLIDNILIEA
jgi:pantoate--beta-alanine ligase